MTLIDVVVSMHFLYIYINICMDVNCIGKGERVDSWAYYLQIYNKFLSEKRKTIGCFGDKNYGIYDWIYCLFLIGLLLAVIGFEKHFKSMEFYWLAFGLTISGFDMRCID